MALKITLTKTDKDARIPAYAHPGDAGVDLYSTEEIILNPGERKLVPTGIKIAIPEGFEAHIRPKSGLALKHGISLINSPGTVDAGYRGEISVIAINLGQEPYHIEKFSKIAQMVFNKVEQAEFVEVEELDETSRGEGGFGSTGIKQEVTHEYQL